MEEARARGDVAPTARVWCEGWPDWKEASEVWAAPKAQVTIPPVRLEERCVECGVYESGLLPIGGALVCDRCKPQALEKLRQGVLLGGPKVSDGAWRDGKAMVVRKGGTLPNVCYKCGGQPHAHLKRKVAWHSPWIYLTILVSLFVYIIVALIVRKTTVLFFPVCENCRTRHRILMVIGTVGFLGGLAAIIAGMTSNSPGISSLSVFGWIMMPVSLIWAFAIQFVTARKMHEDFVWLNRAGKNLLQTLPQWPGR